MPGAESSSSELPDSILVDTDVFSYVFRSSPEADSFRPYFVGRTLTLSFMSVAELYHGAFRARWGASRIDRLETRIGRFVVLRYDKAVCIHWARLKADCDAKGCPLSHPDLWIAACALHHGCALATNNVQHFRNVAGLTIVGPANELS